MPRMSTSTRRGTACARSRAAAPRGGTAGGPLAGAGALVRGVGADRRQSGLPAAGRATLRGPPFFVSPMDRPGLVSALRTSTALKAGYPMRRVRPDARNPGLAATRCLLRNNATAARPSGPAGYGRCGAAPAPLRASRGARAGPPSGRDAVRRAVRRPWRGSSR